MLKKANYYKMEQYKTIEKYCWEQIQSIPVCANMLVEIEEELDKSIKSVDIKKVEVIFSKYTYMLQKDEDLLEYIKLLSKYLISLGFTKVAYSLSNKSISFEY